MNNLYEALEVCLQDIELGANIETSLLRYPDLADELRPILETSIHAKELVAPVPSENVIRRNRSRFLQRAAELRQAPVKPSQTLGWFSSIRRAAIALTVLTIILLSGTGLVRASSTTLPGDNLYPVKRTCEDLALFFTFDSLRRNSLEVEYENERLEELYKLIAQGRSAEVDFAGVVTQQNRSAWQVSGILVIVSSQTDLHDGPVVVGDAVRVFGITQMDNSVLAERIDQLPPDANLPDLGNSGQGSNGGSNSGSSSGNDNNDNDNNNDNGGPGNGDDDNGDNSGPGSGNDNGNENNSGSGSGQDDSNENDEDNSGSSGGGDDNENNSGSGSGDDNNNEDNSGSGGGNENDEDNSGPGGGGGDDD